MIKRLSSAVFFVMILLSSCNSTLGKKDYIKWVRDYENGLHKKVEHDGVIVDVQYKPVDLIMVTENIAASADSSSKEDLEGMTYFTVKIRHKDNKDIFKYNLSSQSEYQKRLYYYSFSFRDQISLKVGEQILPCVAFHFEKSYSMSPDKTFLIGFETDTIPKDKDLTLVINDEVFSSHVFEISYTNKEIKSIPKLKLS